MNGCKYNLTTNCNFFKYKNMTDKCCSFTGKHQDVNLDEEKKGAILKPSKLPVLLNLCVTLVLVISSSIYFQIKLIWAESHISNLENDLNWLRKEMTDSPKSISKRSTPMTVIQQQLVSDATTQGVEGVILEGGILHQYFGDNATGRIGPWRFTKELHPFLDLTKRNTEVRIKLKGLYFIYAQITYITSEQFNSYEILTYKANQTRADHRTLTICSQSTGIEMISHVHEISCYTGIAQFFDPDDKIYLNQVERNRHINLAKGYSYFGILKMKEEN